MEIAVSGFNPQFGASASVEAVQQRQRQQQESQRQSTANDQRAQENQRNQNRTEANQRTPQPARVIDGEVLSSETSRVAPQASNQNTLSRQSANQQPNDQPASRRISQQQALQNFQENEALVPGDNVQRQVSGIIDTFA